MSIDTTHVALANEQQLQQMVGNPDPRVSIPAAARLAKLIQTRNSQQNQQAMGMPATPTVRDQLQQAAAPAPQDSGIAMAAGGIVRHFDGSEGSVPMSMPDAPDTSVPGMVTGTPYEDKMAEINAPYQEGDTMAAWLKVPRAIRDLVSNTHSGIQSAMGDPTWDKLGTGFQDLYTEKGSGAKQAGAAAAARAALEHPELAAQLAAKVAPKLPLGIGTQGPTAAQLAAKLNPKAAKPNTGPGSGLNAAISTDTLESGPVNGTKVKAASEGGGDLPEDTHMQRADELIAQLDPLQKKRLENEMNASSAEEARYKALQAAKRDPNKFVAAMNDIVRMTRHYSNANVGKRGNLGTAVEGSYGLAVEDQAMREKQANEEAAHQKILAGITSGMTDQQMKDLLGNYGIKNQALTADQTQEIKKQRADATTAQAENARLKAEQNAPLIAARIAKLHGTGVGGANKPLTAAQWETAVRNLTNDIVKSDPTISPQAARASAERAVHPIGTPAAIQSKIPTTGSSGKTYSFTNIP